MSHSLPFNNTNFKTQSHSSARFPLRVREVHSNQFLECCSCINLLKQWMILFTCDLQASQKQWKPHPFGWNTRTTPLSTYRFPIKWFCSKHWFCVFCCWFLLVSAFLLGLFFYSITRLSSEEVPLPQVSMFHLNSSFILIPKPRAFLGHAMRDCVLNQHAAAIWGWPEARG